MHADDALVPAHPLPIEGEPIPLYIGPITFGGEPAHGQVEFRMRPRPDLVWSVEPDRCGRAVTDIDLTDLELVIPHALGPVAQVVQRRGRADGWLQPVEIGSPTAALHRVVVGWLNLPAFHSPGVIEDCTWTFTGRWTADLDGWHIVLDRRGDHRAIWSRIRDGGTEITHTMQISRVDRTTFSPNAAQQVLDALHLGLSFAVGRWVAPVPPVGFDAHGDRVWESWGTRYCTAGAPGALSWWYQQREWELRELLGLVAASYADPSRQFSTRFLLTSATLAAAGGFVEQRITTATAALEHLAWVALTVDGGISTSAYKAMSAAARLALVADAASIDDTLSESLTPNLYRYAQDRQSDCATAPVVFCAVRNKIVHPTGHEDDLYRKYPKLVTETWLLARHYLVLLILHRLGYQGNYQPQLTPGGWAGDVEPVPWTAADSAD